MCAHKRNQSVIITVLRAHQKNIITALHCITLRVASFFNFFLNKNVRSSRSWNTTKKKGNGADVYNALESRNKLKIKKKFEYI